MTDSRPSPGAVADELPARLTYVGRPDTPALIHVRRRDRRERTVRAVKGLATCWGLAIVTVLVPLLHFVLVPGFFVAGPLFALQRLGEHMTVLDARGECPGCGAPQTFAIGTAPAARMPLRCERCSRQVFLEPGPETLARG